jgi:hypothetical protein
MFLSLVASFYAECPAKHIQIDGCLWTKSKFLGLSVAVHMIGDATLTLLDHDERYVMTFPSAYGRYIIIRLIRYSSLSITLIITRMKCMRQNSDE